MTQTRRQVVRRLRRKRFNRRLTLFSIGEILVYFGVKNMSFNEAVHADTTAEQEIALLNASFSSTKSTLSGYLLHNWSSMAGTYVSETELSTMADGIVQDLQIANAKLWKKANSGENYLQVEGTWPNHTDVKIVLSSFAPTTSTGATDGNANATSMITGNTVLVVSAQSQSNTDNTASGQYEMISNAVSNAGFTPQISACLTGYRGDTLMGVHAKALAERALAAVSAVKVEGLTQNLETSLSGYTPNGLTYVLTDGQRMNLQVAVHSDSYHHRTNVLVGTPIITTAY